MAIQNISGSNSSSISQVKFKSNNEPIDDTSKRELVREKREEANRVIKKVYHRGIFVGVVVTSIAFFADLITNHYLDKQAAKEANELGKSILKDANVPMGEIEQLASNGLKDTQTTVKHADEFYIPIISTIKKAVRGIKK